MKKRNKAYSMPDYNVSYKKGYTEQHISAYAELYATAPLSHDEEINAAIAAKVGDVEARNKLITSNIRFVKKIAATYVGSGELLADLVSEGCIGLMKAVDKFDVLHEVRLVSYAAQWIHQRCQNYILYNNSLIRTPRSNSRDNKKNIPFIANFIDNENTLNHENLTITPFSNEEIDNKRDINNILTCLTDDEQELIKQFYGIDCDAQSLRTLQQQYNCSHETIRKRIILIIKKLREYNNINKNNPICTKNERGKIPKALNISVYISKRIRILFMNLCKINNISMRHQIFIIITNFIKDEKPYISILTNYIPASDSKYMSYEMPTREIVNSITIIFKKYDIRLGIGIGALIKNWTTNNC